MIGYKYLVGGFLLFVLLGWVLVVLLFRCLFLLWNKSFFFSCGVKIVFFGIVIDSLELVGEVGGFLIVGLFVVCW